MIDSDLLEVPPDDRAVRLMQSQAALACYRGYDISPAHYHEQRRTTLIGILTDTAADFVRLSDAGIRLADSYSAHNFFGGSTHDAVVKTEHLSVRIILQAKNKEDKHITIDTDGEFFCMKINPNITREEIIGSIKTMLGAKASNPFCIFSDGRRIDNELDLLDFPNLAMINILFIKQFTWHIFWRMTHNSDFRFTLKCRNTHTLSELREQFFKSHSAALKMTEDNFDSPNLWFTWRDQVLTDNVLHTVRLLKRDSNVLGYPSHQSYLSDADTFELFLHIQPPDAVPVKVTFKTDPAKSAKTVRMMVVSPQISAQDLRTEVSKVVEQQPASLKIVIERKKLDSQLDLAKVLSSPRCTIMAEPEETIQLRVLLTHVPESEQAQQCILRVFPYEVIGRLKHTICQKTASKEGNVDLHFDGKVLTDDEVVAEKRIQQDDTILALVHTNRVCISIRTTARKWHDMIVDDCQTSTVADLKFFSQTLENRERTIPTCEVVAVFQGLVLSDKTTLSEAGITTETSGARIVMVPVESQCFTASSSCNGKLPVLCDTGKGDFECQLAMSDGQNLFYAPGRIQTPEDIQAMLTERRSSSSPKVQLKGFRKCCDARQRTLLGHRQSPVYRRDTVNAPCSTTTDNTEPASTQQAPVSVNKEDKADSEEWETASESEIEGGRALPQTEGATQEVTQPGPSGADHSMEVSKFECTPPAEKPTIHHSQSAPPTICKPDESNASCRDVTRSWSTSSVLSRAADWARSATSGSESRDPDSESDTGQRRNFVRKILKFENLRENPDSTWTYVESSESETIVPAQIGKMGYSELARLKALSSPDDSDAPGATALQPITADSGVRDEPFYKYIKGTIIRKVARQLGSEGMMVVRELGVTEDVITIANHRHPTDIVEQHLFCLNQWCKKSGQKASKEALKEALRKHDRNDLVEIVDEDEIYAS